MGVGAVVEEREFEFHPWLPLLRLPGLPEAGRGRRLEQGRQAASSRGWQGPSNLSHSLPLCKQHTGRTLELKVEWRLEPRAVRGNVIF